MVSRFRPLAAAGLLWLAGCAAGTPAPSEPPSPLPTVRVTGGGKTTGPLVIDRIEITFENGFGSITVDRGARLTARAVVRFSGNGVFRATWLVDGRPLEQVQHLVTYGETLTVEAGRVAPLPTFEPGGHTLTLKVEQPAGAIRAPVVRYFVR